MWFTQIWETNMKSLRWTKTKCVYIYKTKYDAEEKDRENLKGSEKQNSLIVILKKSECQHSSGTLLQICLALKLLVNNKPKKQNKV